MILTVGRIRWFLLALAVLLAPAGAMAASVYSMVLIGESVESGDIRAVSLGGSSQLLVDSLGATHSNPALLSRIPRVTVAANQYVAVDRGRSDDYTERDGSFTFANLRAVFPVMSLVRLSIGYQGRYDPEGGFSLRDTTDGGDWYTKPYEKTGGLFSVPLTASFDVTRFVSLGLTFSLERGMVEERWEIVFDGPGFAPGAGLKKYDLNGKGYGIGAVLQPVRSLLIGGTYESRIEYDADIYEKYTQSALDTSYAGEVTLPARVTAGISWQWKDRLLLLASAVRSDFTQFKGMGFPSERLAMEEKYCFGLEYLPGVGLRGKRIPLRAGFSYGRLPFEYPDGKTVNKYLVSIGTGISIRGGRGKVDIGLAVGKDGSIDENGIENRLFRVHIGLSGSEEWKRKGAEM